MEDGYSRDMSSSDAVDLALRGLTAAMKRDSASGDGYLVHVITPKEYRELSDDEINKRLKALKIPLPPHPCRRPGPRDARATLSREPFPR